MSRSSSSAGCWPFLTAATLAGHLTVLVLAVSLRAVKVTHTEVTIVEAFAAWTLARILGATRSRPAAWASLGLTAVLVAAFGARATPRRSRRRWITA